MLATGGAVGLWAAALIWWDLRHRRLPDYLVLPAGVIATAVAVALPEVELARIGWALTWPGLLLGCGVLIGGIGGGDIKLAWPLAMGLVMVAPPGLTLLTVLAAVALSTLLSLAAAMLVVLLRRHRNAAPVTVPHGPAMLAATAVVGYCSWSAVMERAGVMAIVV